MFTITKMILPHSKKTKYGSHFWVFYMQSDDACNFYLIFSTQFYKSSKIIVQASEKEKRHIQRFGFGGDNIICSPGCSHFYCESNEYLLKKSLLTTKQYILNIVNVKKISSRLFTIIVQNATMR